MQTTDSKDRTLSRGQSVMATNAMPKMQPQTQGKIVAEYGAIWKMTKSGKVQVGEEWHVMFPNGSVQVFTSKTAVEKAAKAYFQKTVKSGCVGIGKIEWRT